MEEPDAFLEDFRNYTEGKRYNTIYADPPWQFQNRTGKVSPEHRRLARYSTLTAEEIRALPVAEAAGEKAHLYLWVPNALLPDGLAVMDAWGFEYKSNIIWEKVRKDGNPDGRGVGFYFRNVTEMVLFGIRKESEPNRTLAPARSQVNLIRSMKREYSRKPDEIIPLIEACSQGPRLALFAWGIGEGWDRWGREKLSGSMPPWEAPWQAGGPHAESGGMISEEDSVYEAIAAGEQMELELLNSQDLQGTQTDRTSEDGEDAGEQMELDLSAYLPL